MDKIKLDAYAKINLSLDVLGKKENGYHELSMIMQQIDLKDTISISEIPEQNKLIINCNNPKVPLDSTNIVYKVWKILSDRYNINKGICIDIQKNIPLAGGLAGGSTDAAAVLKGLNKMWDLELTDKELMDISLDIGSDIPFCIMGGTALAEGIGEELTPLKSFSNKYILLANPDIEVSTAYVYKNLDMSQVKERPNINNIIDYIEKDDIHSLANEMKNVLETVTINKYTIINEIKDDMIEQGAIGSLMSGSGATVFGIFDDEDKLNRCKEKLEEKIKIVIATKTI